MQEMDLSVLLVEDDPVALERLAALLRREVKAVITATDGLAGLDAFRERRPDIVVTDIRMPRMDGMEMARAIRGLNEDVPVIMCSAHNETQYFVEAIDIGVDHYVLKPVDQHVLLRAVGKCGERIWLRAARRKAEDELRKANEMLEQRVKERTAALEQALDRVSLSQQEWQNTFDSIGDMICIIDRDFSILKSNHAFASLAGKDGERPIGDRCYDHICSEPGGGEFCPHLRTLQDGLPHSGEVRGRDGRIFKISTYPHRSGSGELLGSVHVARDITEDKERELRMIVTERLSTLGQMTAGIAHEIKNPMATISGCAELLSERVESGRIDPEKFKTHLTIISDEVFRCTHIIDSVLSSVRPVSLEENEIGLEKVLDRTIEMINYQGRLRMVSVVKHYRGDTPAVRAPEGLLRQVALIIMSNALDAMQNSGTITVETDVEGDSSIFRVSDTGPGIPQHYLNRIFDPFFTSKGSRNGTGLGLSIARQIVENLKGTVTVERTGPEGTTFRIALPSGSGGKERA